MEKVRNRIRLLRERHSLTQKEFAEKLSMSASYIAKVDRGDRIPSLKLIRKIAEVFQMPIDIFQDDGIFLIPYFRYMVEWKVKSGRSVACFYGELNDGPPLFSFPIISGGGCPFSIGLAIGQLVKRVPVTRIQLVEKASEITHKEVAMVWEFI